MLRKTPVKFDFLESHPWTLKTYRGIETGVFLLRFSF